MTDHIDGIIAGMSEAVARQSGRPQTQRKVIIGPHGWTLATVPVRARLEASNG